MNMMKLRVSGDHLHTSAIVDPDFHVISAVNDRNDYAGPGTGYQVTDERWAQIQDIPNALEASDFK
jgi:propanediol dehydratase large subunit